MELKIIKQEDNPLLRRKEVWFEVRHDKAPTPKKIDVAQVLAAKLNAKLDLMIIKHYTTKFGTNVSRGLCLVYEDEEAMIKAEPLKILNPKKRIGLKEEEKEEGEKQEKEEEKNEAQTQ